jgi:hypothetical protein
MIPAGMRQPEPCSAKSHPSPQTLKEQRLFAQRLDPSGAFEDQMHWYIESECCKTDG